jgi:hypothetical protein
MVQLEFEVGGTHIRGPRVGLDVMDEVFLVPVHEGEHLLHESLHIDLGFSRETLPHLFCVLLVEHLLVLHIYLLLFDVHFSEELVHIHVVLSMAIVLRKTG